ncbi:mannosyl-3-phosphoglycerate synthase [Schizothecium vesticola]|uniref:Mannosyl-3-phosphoglycerate synthase n=1 Tax=Schizothecium vesticola TaxID=314040 RepID=A0AA40KBL3_9PEZI|nr:mannosyl-3-phosphoglycerate synthase [Schizothecium vesticola]
MRITNPFPGATIGLTTIMREASVLELDAGYHPGPPIRRLSHQDSDEAPATFAPSPSALYAIHAFMVLIIPCKNEDPSTLLGVLQGIPHPCTILLVSASRDPAQYDAEAALLRDFCRPGGRRGLAIHQRDPVASAALAAAGMAPSLFDYAGAVRTGKGEGMILGTAVALALFPELRYVGFLDADAKMPGAPHEYCRVYATGFALHHATSRPHKNDDDDVMVRIRWGSKPKPRKDGSGGLDFGVAEGRSSRIVNEWMNRFVRAAGGGGGEDKIITTGNAGEHAMTMSLARKLQLAGGYAIEPFHFVDLFMRQMRATAAASASACPSPASLGVPGYDSDVVDTLHLSLSPIQVVQIKTINAHIHRETDDAHVRNMWKMGLGTLYHHLLPQYIQSPYVRQDVAERMLRLRADMEAFVEENNREFSETTPKGQPLLPEPRVYPALETLDMEVLRKTLESSRGSLVRFGF